MKGKVEDYLAHWGLNDGSFETAASIAYDKNQALLDENGLYRLTRIGFNGEDVEINSYVDDMGRVYDGSVSEAIAAKDNADMKRFHDMNADAFKKNQLLGELTQTPPLNMTDNVIDISPDTINTGQLYINDLFNR